MSEVVERLRASVADRYTIERELGAGGMATVYLAHDVRHDRKVALKVLRPELAAVVGAERFLTEIKTTANLQHPHILPLHDSGQVEGTVFYVMPYVEGESLRDRLNREKQLPVKEAVRIAAEVADALDYAHRQNVIHRDIKPENILLHDGRALMADFGIALAMTEAGGARMTETGMSLGTPSYMSPEQAMGERELDARSDIYALGCVLYEMLAGEPPFTGPTAQAIVAKVLTAEPESLTTYRKTVPPHVEAAVHTALQKLPADRPATAADFKTALSDAGAASRLTQAARPVSRGVWGGLAIAGVVGLAAGIALAALIFRPAPASEEVIRLQMVLGDSTTIEMVDNHRLAISPDGRRVAFVGSYVDGSALWVRDLDAMTATLLSGTTGAFRPFFSPDGESIGFLVAEVSGADIRVVAAEGGIVRTVVDDSASGFGADWARDGRIYFSRVSNLGLAAVPATGGSIVQISLPEPDSGATEHNYPHVLPGNRIAIVQLWRGSVGSNAIGAVDLQTGEVTPLLDGTYARYLAPDRLIVGSSDGRLYAVGFDPENLRLVGDPVPVAGAVDVESGNGTVQFALSENGTLLYQLADTTGRELVWVDREGAVAPADTALKAGIEHVALSPDGSRVAMTISDSRSSSIWVKHLPGGAMTRLTFEGEESDRPVWTPDGIHVAYLGTRDGRRLAWMRRADASGEERQAVPGSLQLNEVAFHPSGTTVVVRPTGITPRSLYVAELGVDSAPRPLLPTRSDNYAATLSPDGRWLAYVSVESGSPEVFVRPFPAVDSARYSISVGGGAEPLWSRTGRELFYRTPRGDVMAVPLSLGATFSHGKPRPLFRVPGMHSDRYHRAYDVSANGERFLMIRSTRPQPNSLVMVFNWSRELERFLETQE